MLGQLVNEMIRHTGASYVWGDTLPLLKRSDVFLQGRPACNRCSQNRCCMCGTVCCAGKDTTELWEENRANLVLRGTGPYGKQSLFPKLPKGGA